MTKFVLRGGATFEVIETPGCVHEVSYVTSQGVIFHSLPTTLKNADAMMSELHAQGVTGLAYRLLPTREAYAKLMGEAESIRKQIEARKKRPTIGLGPQEEVDSRKEEALLQLADRADELEAQARELPVN